MPAPPEHTQRLAATAGDLPDMHPPRPTPSRPTGGRKGNAIGHVEYAGSLLSDRCNLLYENFLTSFLANCLLATLMVWSQSARIDHAILAQWLVAIFVALLIRAAIFARYRRQTGKINYRYWIVLYVTGVVVCSAIWAVGGVYISTTGDMYAIGMATAVMAGIAAGAVATLGAVFAGCAIFLMVLTFPYALALMISGQRDETLLGIMMLAFLVFTLSAAKRYEHTLIQAFDSRYDVLTRLRNRQGFEEILNQSLHTFKGARSTHVIAFLDLDRFKIVNDTAGHIAGDELLREIAGVIQSAIGDSGCVCRIGGDEFVILFPRSSINTVRPQLVTAKDAIWAHRHRASNRVFRVTASIGVIEVKGRQKNAEEILAAADLAAYAAKNQGGNRIHISHYPDDVTGSYRDQIAWVTELEAAMDEGRLLLVGQYIEVIDAKRHLSTGRSIELLLRMTDGSNRILPAAEFIPAAEQFGLMSMIDKWVVKEAFTWLNTNRLALSHLEVCYINLSAQSLGDEEFSQYLSDQLKSLQFPASQICFEITEGECIRDMETAIGFVERFRRSGCKFALDDFGHGFSSFNYLQSLPVDVVKIDKSYVTSAPYHASSAAIVRAIKDLSHAMGKVTIAEGVENNTHLSFLRALGVDYVQGHAVHRPQRLDELLKSMGHNDSSRFQARQQSPHYVLTH